MPKPTCADSCEVCGPSPFHPGDIVVSVTDTKPVPTRWQVKHVDEEGYVTADALPERFTPVTGIYKADWWKKVE